MFYKFEQCLLLRIKKNTVKNRILLDISVKNRKTLNVRLLLWTFAKFQFNFTFTQNQ